MILQDRLDAFKADFEAGKLRPYVPSLILMRRLTLDVGARVARMGRAEPHTRKVSREGL